MRRLVPTFAATCLLVVWIATPLLALAHVALEEHRYCAEHEQLEEGADGHAQGAERGAPDANDTPSSTLTPGDPGDSQVEHEGCAFGESFPLEDHFVLPSDLASEPALASEAPPVPGVRALAAKLPLFLFAPKNSPPPVA